ncbi:DUF6123 family protein [Lederbergia wuyishanensis]|uniref:Uncharacterized protein n=1 Tax=Lederbergia wuyishanensis TaxID=1347903 RepID=A0ABU0D0T3_9BACI|nr:DUF6123 family protein [Lederbergia wuyishanensis]MCJ8006619.1 DUF6123 family protein [Lederbergia wuyishanensis]MDQ0342000.1 hypothetical protein [Lederbergia wuyishanensis]
MITELIDLENYLMTLEAKGFKFKDEAISFIYFGKQSTGTDDYIVSLAIELTLKTQKRFDGSFYLSILERLKEHNIKTKTEAYGLMEKMGLKAHK